MPRYRQPTANSSESDFTDYTRTLWTDLDGWYGFWVRRWAKVMDFLRSQHWNATKVLTDAQIPDWKRYPVSNLTLAFYSDMLKEWLQSRVRFSAIPDSPAPEDIEAADIADYALRYMWDVLELEDKRIDIGAWLISTGNADVRVRWDEDSGQVAPLVHQLPDGTLVPVNPQTGQPDPNMQEPVMIPEGEIELDVISPQLCRWPHSKVHGVQVGSLITYDEAIDLYGADIADKLSYSKGDTWGALSIDILSPTLPYNPIIQEETALVVSHYLPRSSRNREGLWWSASGSQLIEPPTSLPAGIIPVAHFRWIPMPGHRNFGLSPLYDMTGTNKVYDESLQRAQEWSNKVVPKMLLKSGGGIAPGDMTDEPFQELTVPEGLEPDVIRPPDPPRVFGDLMEISREDSLFVAGYRFLKGQDIPSGEATQRLRKPPMMLNEGEPVALAQISSKSSWQMLGNILLSYAGAYYDDNKIASTAGKDRVYQWRTLQTSVLKDLRSRLRVDEIPLYTWNRQSLKDSVISMLNTPGGQMLFMGPDGQLDKDRIQAAIEAVGLDVTIPLTDPDVTEAKNEINMFRNLQEGQAPPEAKPWQDHQIHLDEKLREVKGLAFQSWPEQAREALMQNISQHEQALSEAQQQMQQAELEMEKQLRGIRAEMETQQDVRTELGKMLIERIGSAIEDALTGEGESPEREE